MRFFIKWAFIRWLLMLAGLLWFILSLSNPQMAVGAAPVQQEAVWVSGPYYANAVKPNTTLYELWDQTFYTDFNFLSTAILVKTAQPSAGVDCSFEVSDEINTKAVGAAGGTHTRVWTSTAWGDASWLFGSVGFSETAHFHWSGGSWYTIPAENTLEFKAQVGSVVAATCSFEYYLVHYSIVPTVTPTSAPTATATPVVNTCWEAGIGTPTPDWDNVPPEYAVCLEMCTEPGATATPPWAIPTLGCLELDITPFVPPCYDEASCETATANPPTPLPTMDLPGCYTPTVALTSTPGGIPIDPICYLPPGEREDDPIVLDFGQVIVTDGACYTLVPGIDITIPAFLGLWAEFSWSSYEWEFCIDWVTIPDMSIAGIQYTNQLIIGAAVLVIMSLLFKL